MTILKVLLLLLLLAPFSGKAQDSIKLGQKTIQYDSSKGLQPVSFNKEKIESYKKDPAYNYLEKVKNESWWTRFKNWLSQLFNKFYHWLFGDYKGNRILVFLLKTLPYLFIAGLIALIVWLFIRLNPGKAFLGNQTEPETFLNEEEKLVKSGNLSEMLKKAIQDENYRLAVRFYYLQLLSRLNKTELITYSFEKTNADYLSEIHEASLAERLRKIMRIYDFIWYGNFDISETDFLLAQEKFSSLNKTLKLPPNEH